MGWMDGRMDRQTDGWTDGRTDRQTDRWMDLDMPSSVLGSDHVVHPERPAAAIPEWGALPLFQFTSGREPCGLIPTPLTSVGMWGLSVLGREHNSHHNSHCHL